MNTSPERCPRCQGQLSACRLCCDDCGEEVVGTVNQARLVNLPDPHATLLEHFLRVRGNMKEMERELGLAYSTVRARLDEAFQHVDRAMKVVGQDPAKRILDDLEAGKWSVSEAVSRLYTLRTGGDHER